MGTVTYAIHSVALGITDMAESFRDSTSSYSYVELREHRDDLCKQSLRVLKKLIVPALCLPLGLEVILVFIMHGKVDIANAAIATALYSLAFLVYPLYDITSAAIQLSTVRQSAILMSLITAFWRVGALWVMIQLFGATIPVFGAVYFLDYLSRVIFLRSMLHRERNTLRKEAIVMDRDDGM